jgi:hypothetical protein
MIAPSLVEAIGAPICRVRCIHYVFNGQSDTDFGPVELTIGERTFLFDNEPDGDSLRVSQEAWVDPFSEPLTEQNRAFIETSGKWTAFDVSAEGSWTQLIGERLSAVEPVMDDAEKTTGVVLRTEHGGMLRLGVMADELFVDGLINPG